MGPAVSTRRINPSWSIAGDGKVYNIRFQSFWGDGKKHYLRLLEVNDTYGGIMDIIEERQMVRVTEKKGSSRTELVGDLSRYYELPKGDEDEDDEAFEEVESPSVPREEEETVAVDGGEAEAKKEVQNSKRRSTHKKKRAVVLQNKKKVLIRMSTVTPSKKKYANLIVASMKDVPGFKWGEAKVKLDALTQDLMDMAIEQELATDDSAVRRTTTKTSTRSTKRHHANTYIRSMSMHLTHTHDTVWFTS